MADNRFTHIGMNNIVQNSKVLFITQPGNVTAERYVENAKKHNKFHNATLGRKFKSLLVLDDGTVIMSCIKPKTLMNRFNGITGADKEEEEEE